MLVTFYFLVVLFFLSFIHSFDHHFNFNPSSPPTLRILFFRLRITFSNLPLYLLRLVRCFLDLFHPFTSTTAGPHLLANPPKTSFLYNPLEQGLCLMT